MSNTNKKSKSGFSDAAVVIWGILLFLLLFTGIVLVGGLVTWAVWDVIFVPVAHGLGWAAFPKIGFWLAVGINFVWGILTAPFRRSRPVSGGDEA